MKSLTHRHWSYVPAGLVLSALLIMFWYLNQSYLTPARGSEALFLENPVPAFALMIIGAFVAASIAGEFSIKAPLTIEPLVFALAGGAISGAGSVIAGMSVHSVVLFNLAGVFTLPAFMITKGWLYLAFMVAGGAVGSRLLVFTTYKLVRSRREIFVPRELNDRRSRVVYSALAALLFIGLAALLILPAPSDRRIPVALGMCLMAALGFAAERCTVCLSSMLKELFISHSSYVWRNVLFTIMSLALMYQIGLQLQLYAPIAIDSFVTAPVLLAAGSFVMGLGFVFADGCFIGSLWKTGQGNLVNVAGLVGLVVGIGGARMAGQFVRLPVSASPIPNELSSLADAWILVAALWIVGIAALLLFRQKRYHFG